MQHDQAHRIIKPSELAGHAAEDGEASIEAVHELCNPEPTGSRRAIQFHF